MSSNTPQNIQDQEIDLAQVSKKISGIFESILDGLFRFILFIKRNIIILVVLFILGAVLGWYMDRTNKVYTHEVIVMPNFGSTDYIYNQINLISSKLEEKDSVFLKSMGLNSKNVLSIEIEPVTDIYGFVNSEPHNFELIKLMAEDGDINKIIDEEVTSINYTKHKIKIETKTVAKDDLLKPFLSYLNSNEFYSKIRKSGIVSIEKKIEESEKMISQIDTLISKASVTKSNSQNSLVNLNEKSDANELLNLKNDLIDLIGQQRISLIETENLIQEVSRTANIMDTKGISKKKMLLLPFVFVIFYFLIILFTNFYRKRSVNQ